MRLLLLTISIILAIHHITYAESTEHRSAIDSIYSKACYNITQHDCCLSFKANSNTDPDEHTDVNILLKIGRFMNPRLFIGDGYAFESLTYKRRLDLSIFTIDNIPFKLNHNSRTDISGSKLSIEGNIAVLKYEFDYLSKDFSFDEYYKWQRSVFVNSIANNEYSHIRYVLVPKEDDNIFQASLWNIFYEEVKYRNNDNSSFASRKYNGGIGTFVHLKANSVIKQKLSDSDYTYDLSYKRERKYLILYDFRELARKRYDAEINWARYVMFGKPKGTHHVDKLIYSWQFLYIFRGTNLLYSNKHKKFTQTRTISSTNRTPAGNPPSKYLHVSLNPHFGTGFTLGGDSEELIHHSQPNDSREYKIGIKNKNYFYISWGGAFSLVYLYHSRLLGDLSFGINALYNDYSYVGKKEIEVSSTGDLGEYSFDYTPEHNTIEVLREFSLIVSVKYRIPLF